MPINSFVCPNCNKHNNYIVELDEDKDQTVVCAVCNEPTTITYDELPERIVEQLEEIEQINAFFSDSYKGLFAQSEDSVEEALIEIDKKFAEAKGSLSEFDHSFKVDTDILSISDEYAPQEEDEIISPRRKTITNHSSASGMKNVSSSPSPSSSSSSSSQAQQLRSILSSDNPTRSMLLSAIDIADSKTRSGSGKERMLQYMQYVLNQENGSAFLTDTEKMKEFGLKKYERVLLKNLVERTQTYTGVISGIIDNNDREIR